MIVRRVSTGMICPGSSGSCLKKNLLVDDNNAKCAYLDGFYNVDGDSTPHDRAEKVMRGITIRLLTWPGSGTGSIN